MCVPQIVRIGVLSMGITLALAANGFTQSRPSDGGKTDPTQLQRNREVLDLNPIEKPKAEIEILTVPDQASPPAQGKIVIVPDEPAQPPSPPAKEQETPTQKKDDY